MNDIPANWSATGNTRPTYMRTDGFKVVLDAPGRWGVRIPAHVDHPQMGMGLFDSQCHAMQWVDQEFPLEG